MSLNHVWELRLWGKEFPIRVHTQKISLAEVVCGLAEWEEQTPIIEARYVGEEETMTKSESDLCPKPATETMTLEVLMRPVYLWRVRREGDPSIGHLLITGRKDVRAVLEQCVPPPPGCGDSNLGPLEEMVFIREVRFITAVDPLTIEDTAGGKKEG